MLAIAVATYLAFRRDEIDDDPADILGLAIARRVTAATRRTTCGRGWTEQGVAI